jgi:hypothetical protein
MPKINVYNEFYNILDWYNYYQYKGLVLVSDDGKKYSALTADSHYFKKNTSLQSYLATKKQKDYIDYEYMNNSLYKINDNFTFRIIINLENKYIGYIFNGEELVNENINIENIELINDCMFIINDLRILTKINKKQKEYKTKKEREEILEYGSDKLIFNIIGDVVLVKDIVGRVRFKETPFSIMSEMIFLDIQKAFENYIEGKNYTLKDLIYAYMQHGYSVNGFFEIFDKFFIDEDQNYYEESTLIKIISGEKDVSAALIER